MSTSICGATTIEWPSAGATIQIAKEARIVCFTVMIHIQVDTVTIREHRMEGVPLDTDVVNKLSLNTEVRHEVLGSMTYVDAVMPIAPACLLIHSP